MTKKLEVYKCPICGNIVEVLNAGGGQLVCCGKPMDLLEEKRADSTTEKHVPVVEKVDGGVKVKVGSVPHPMEEKHLIQWVQIISGDLSQRAFLNPGQVPEAFFKGEFDEIAAREFCNLHGLWRS